MLKDIENREDLFVLLSDFYKRLLSDQLLKPIFKKFEDPEVLQEHLIILVDFWDQILFFSNTYHKNAMKPHLEMQHKHPFEKEHFDTWISLFNAAVDAHFEGEHAHTMKTRALSIATVMHFKVKELKKT